MGSDQWQKIKEIFNEALRIGPDERDAFIENACSGDAALRREVEDLLDSFENAEGFMDSPAAYDNATLIIGKQSKPEKGDTIAHYEIVSQIGEGGMGEIYLARDTHLKRKVALKLLAEHISADKVRVDRFRQEAFAVSALNHPNILTIHEIGEWKGRDFIATEFIEGTTLRTQIKNKHLSITESLEIAIQTGGALAAAHGEGIVHRDIKPENIMIRPDGLVKVLDFGIAKYLPSDRDQPSLVQTQAGEVIGTAAYMSPEQARGLDIDERTDIWSLGVIIYETITGELPFPGATYFDQIAAVIEREPPPINTLVSDAPDDLQRVIARALAKSKEDRYLRMPDLLEDLKNVRESLRHETRVSTAEPIFDQGRKFNWASAALGLLILLLAGVPFWLYLNRGAFGSGGWFASESALKLQAMKITRLSDTSQAVDAAVSPDGEYVAFVKEDRGRQSLWLRQVSAPSSIEIVPAASEWRFGSPKFSPDGSHIYYLKAEPMNVRATLFQIPKLGGQDKKLVDDISMQDSGSSFSLSPDGRQVAFIRLDENFNRSLVLTDLDGTNERQLISRKIPEFLTGAAWSPDGKTIASLTGTFGGKGGYGFKPIVLVNIADSTETTLSDRIWATASGLSWLPDGTALIMSASEDAGFVQLWHVSVPDGQVSRLTNDFSDYAAPSVMTTFSTIATVQTNQSSNIWTVAMDQKGTIEKQLTLGNGGKDGVRGMSVTPDGQIVYTSQAAGGSDIWIINGDGTSNRQLTSSDAIDNFPYVSPDGKFIVFNRYRSGESGIWRMKIDGSDPTQLTTGIYPTFSPDGKYIFFYRPGSIWKIAAEGGEPAQVPLRNKDLANAPVVSPDQTMIAANYLAGEPNAQFRIGVVPIGGGDPLKVFDTYSSAVNTLRWMKDGRTISFVETRDGISNLFGLSLDANSERQITDFPSGRIWNFAWSTDGQVLALARGNITKDVVLVSDYR